MRQVSKRRAARNQQAKPIRTALLARFKQCMVCGASPRNKRWKPVELNALSVHEIARGVHRNKALDKPFACLVVCGRCNLHELVDNRKWPQSRQLAVLSRKAPDLYDLVAFNKLVNENAPGRITQAEVDGSA